MINIFQATIEPSVDDKKAIITIPPLSFETPEEADEWVKAHKGEPSYTIVVTEHIPRYHVLRAVIRHDNRAYVQNVPEFPPTDDLYRAQQIRDIEWKKGLDSVIWDAVLQKDLY